MDNIQIADRLARIEVMQSTTLELLRAHVSKGCADNDCKLNDEVVTVVRDVTTYKRITWAVGTLLLAIFGKSFI